MKRRKPENHLVTRLDLSNCPDGVVLAPLEPENDIARRFFNGWETPLAPWGGFKLPSGLEVLKENGQEVLAFNENAVRVQERSILSKKKHRNGTIHVAVNQTDAFAGPHMDSMDHEEAFAGIVFRAETSRWYYQFGVEGQRRLVLYLRRDDNWTVLADLWETIPKGYLDLEVALDEAAITCRCPALGVDFTVTDSTYGFGRIGLRALGKARLASLEMNQTVAQQTGDDRLRSQRRAALHSAGADIPDAVPACILEHQDLGGSPRFLDFIEPDRYDMLISGETLRAATADGETLWELDMPVMGIVPSRNQGPDGRLLYGFTGIRSIKDSINVTGGAGSDVVYDQMCIIRGRDGRIMAQAGVPPMHETARRPDYSAGTGNLTGHGTDIVVREWRDDKEGGGVNLWAYDEGFNQLWHHEQEGAWYGHHWAVRFCDVDGDGRDELLGGGKLYDARGNVLWVHDRDQEMLGIHGARHYDAVAVGNLAGDTDLDPVAFLMGGSAGVYVVDALTGRTRMRHRVGHAQGCVTGKVREDIPGDQVLVATRWGNMGILTLFSGSGERLWTIQPDYVGQGATPVSWGGAGPQLIWTNTSAHAQAFYDGYGVRVKELTPLRDLWGERMRRDVGCHTLRMGRDGKTYLGMTVDEKTHVFGPEGI